MNRHPYLRAFLAGAFLPTVALPLALTAFIVLRLVMQVPFAIERGLVFPMGLVPVLWGLWNMLWLGTHGRTHLRLGLHGALLPFLLLPGGTLLGSSLGVLSLGAASATWFNAVSVPYGLVACLFTAALIGYYLVWKYIVGFVNRELALMG
ncbi:MAG TPA: hypothetical protein VMA34_05375 [Terracidiphilus sp.]|nr:hypothetical protein [Terracidiphilus sp.]